jgi:hypothetical protein
MKHRFGRHYTRDEARALLPQLRKWLDKLDELRLKMEVNGEQLDTLMASGNDIGGNTVNRSIKLLGGMKEVFQEFASREIIIKDLPRGLVDFPAIIGGKEVFLCWEKDEDDVEYWHDIDSGFAGREPL